MLNFIDENEIMRGARVSSRTADILFSVANWMAISGAALVLLGTLGIFLLGAVRESYSEDRLRVNEEAATQARKQANASHTQSVQLQRTLEHERAEREKIEHRLKPRRLTAEKKAKLSGVVTPFRGYPIFLRVVANNAEGSDLLDEIGDTLAASGWTQGVNIAGDTIHGKKYPDGISTLVSLGASGNPPGLALALSNFFSEEGLASEQPLSANHDVSPNTVMILVGFKPGRNE